MSAHEDGNAALAAATRRRSRPRATVAIRMCVAVATLALTASTSSPLDCPLPAFTWMGGAWPAGLRLPGSAPGLSAWSILTLCKMVTRGTPERGEVRNPWGRAGKPETRILRQQEAQEVAESRAKAWSQVLHGRASRRGGKQDDRDLDADDAVEVSITEDIKDFHERAAMLLRESGGRMNSLTFTYKWEQRFGESLVTFLSRQRLTVAEMLKQSNAFWVVDMPGDHDGAGQMSVYILNEKNLRVENARETLGDQLEMLGKTEATVSPLIKEWRNRRHQGASRLESLMLDDEAAEVALVGMPENESYSFSAARGKYDDDTNEEEATTRQVECMKLPMEVHKHLKLGPLLDSLEPCLSGVDSRFGLRQMHLAWTHNCTCAKSSVIALDRLGKLRQEAKGRQVRRLEEQVKCFAEVVQSGMPTLGCAEIATVLEVIQNRSGYDTLLLFVANRIVQGGMDLVKEAHTCTPRTVTTLVRCMASSGQRDMLLFRQLSSLVQLLPAERFTLGSLAALFESFLHVNVQDAALMRFVGAVLQQLDFSEALVEDVAAMLSALSKAKVQDEVSFRRLSRAVLAMADEVELSAKAAGIILDAFARAKFRDVALFRKLSSVAIRHHAASFTADDVTRLVTASASLGADPLAKALMMHMDSALLELSKHDLSPQHIGLIAVSYAEVGGPANAEVLQRLSAAALTLEPWALDIEAAAQIVKAYSTLHEWDHALFGRVSTVLQQADVSGFELRTIATIVQAYCHKEVRDKALLGRLAVVLQQMDSSVFSSSEAVQEVSVILNAYANAQMNDLALVLSQTLTNHLKPHIGGVTAQAMLNIIRRGVRSSSRPDQRYVGGVREALEISRLDDDDSLHYSNAGNTHASNHNSYSLSHSTLSLLSRDETRLDDEEDLSREMSVSLSHNTRISDLDAEFADEGRAGRASGLGRALVPFSQEYTGSFAGKKKKNSGKARGSAPIPLGWS